MTLLEQIRNQQRGYIDLQIAGAMREAALSLFTESRSERLLRWQMSQQAYDALTENRGHKGGKAP